MDKEDRIKLLEKCNLAFDVFGKELEQVENEIEQAERQLKKLKRKQKDYKGYIKLYKDVERSVFGA